MANRFIGSKELSDTGITLDLVLSTSTRRVVRGTSVGTTSLCPLTAIVTMISCVCGWYAWVGLRIQLRKYAVQVIVVVERSSDLIGGGSDCSDLNNQKVKLRGLEEFKAVSSGFWNGTYL